MSQGSWPPSCRPGGSTEENRRCLRPWVPSAGRWPRAPGGRKPESPSGGRRPPCPGSGVRRLRTGFGPVPEPVAVTVRCPCGAGGGRVLTAERGELAAAAGRASFFLDRWFPRSRRRRGRAGRRLQCIKFNQTRQLAGARAWGQLAATAVLRVQGASVPCEHRGCTHPTRSPESGLPAGLRAHGLLCRGRRAHLEGSCFWSRKAGVRAFVRGKVGAAARWGGLCPPHSCMEALRPMPWCWEVGRLHEVTRVGLPGRVTVLRRRDAGGDPDRSLPAARGPHRPAGPWVSGRAAQEAAAGRGQMHF